MTLERAVRPAGTAGMVPWFLLRRRGIRGTPAPLVALLVLHWWFWIAFIVALPTLADSGTLPSLFDLVLGAPLSKEVEGGIFLVGLAGAFATWLVLVIVSAVIAPRPAGPGDRGWTVAAWVALFAAPALLIAAVLLGTYAT